MASEPAIVARIALISYSNRWLRAAILPSMAKLNLILLPIVQLFLATSAVARDRITPATPLSATETLISEHGSFALGFFTPSQDNNTSAASDHGGDKNYYLAIWYNNIPGLTSVWIANSASPVADISAASLSIDRTGNLALTDSARHVIWSTNVSLTASGNASSVALLTDNGSLMLTDAGNASEVYWQSIDEPTNTWLPGGRLGLDKRTGVNQRLLSWSNDADPSPGVFSLELDPSGSTAYLLQWNRTVTYWSSGPWNGKIFSGVPEMTENYNYNFNFVNNSAAEYFNYSVKYPSVISRQVMDTNGQIKQLTWFPNSGWNLFWSQPRTQCEVYALCGPFGVCNDDSLPFCNCPRGFQQQSSTSFSAGCQRRTQLQCPGAADGFLRMDGMRLPVNPVSSVAASNGDCQAVCLANCSCTACAFNGSGCFLWMGDLINLQEQYTDNGAATLYLRLAASDLEGSRHDKGVITGTVVGVVAAIVIAAGVITVFLVRRIRRRRALKAAGLSAGSLIPFRYSELQSATKNFSEKLGGGAFGSVYKGMLPDSTAIAVKKLDGVQQGEKQFRAEVSTIGTIQHVNLVRLLGFCSDGARKLLVYEFMPNGSLDGHLFTKISAPSSSAAPLSWATRYEIAVGTARGLNYLHEKCRDRIIHCDIKPENILLDAAFTPKVADFGLAKMLGRDFSRALTTMRGTRGYLAPEWITGEPITVKADVFSYGMMLFEMISGRRNSDDGGSGIFFPAVAAARLMDGDVSGLLDRRLNGEADGKEVERLCRVACWCIQEEEANRPTMGQVVQVLEGILDVGVPPIPRPLTIIGESPGYDINFFTDASNSNSTSDRTSSQAPSAAASAASAENRVYH